MKLPEYGAAEDALLQTVMLGHVRMDPLLRRIASEATHHAGPQRVHHENTPIDLPMTAMEATTSLSFDAIRNTDVAAIAASMDEIGRGYVREMTKLFFSAADHVTESAGQVIDAGGRPLSHDLINDMLEQVDLDFDSEGNPKMPSLVMSPADAEALQKLPPPTEEQQARGERIIAEKKAKFDAAKRHRRIPR